MGKGGYEDAVDENRITLCCALCCFNCGCYKTSDALGVSGKAGICCINLEFCCKPGAPYLFPLCCLGITTNCSDCSLINAQAHVCCSVCSAAIPCNDEVPVALVVLGLDLYPKVGCCLTQREMKMHR
ncbi:hypothetical protein MPSEU_001026900 [Mayamaea pseudoterrestris]|nr:hypothetical protein MPSEU_001026900 [Mayamaea pseudoterrestris]